MKADIAPPTSGNEHSWFSRAATDVTAERRRQIEAEGYDYFRDDVYTAFQLGSAAMAYLSLCVMQDKMRSTHLNRDYRPGFWPWDKKWWKPKDRRRDLVRAAALIIAEIERLDRATAEGGAP